MFNAAYWKQTLERAIKTFFQSVLALLSAGYTGLVEVPWLDTLNVGGLAALISVLTSLASVPLGGDTSPSAVTLLSSGGTEDLGQQKRVG